MRLQGPGIAPADAGLPWRDPDVPGKTSPTLAAHRLSGRVMEVSAGFLTHADHQAGRLIALPWPRGELDSTLITVVSGDGAEGRVSGETELNKQRESIDGDR